jgi:hypothetical protein
LIDWLGKLLSDIDISRSAAVAAFFELEAAATAGMEYVLMSYQKLLSENFFIYVFVKGMGAFGRHNL